MHLTPWQILAWLDKDKNLPFPQGGGTEMKTRKLPPQPLLHLWIFCPITFTPHTTSQLVKRNWGICSSETAPSPDRVLSLNKSSYLLSFPPLWILSVMKQNLLSRNNFKGAWLLTLKHFTLAWKIPWMEEPGGLQSMGSQRVGDNWATSLSFFTFMHWRRKWQSTPAFLPGESQGRGSLMGCCLWGLTESDTTEAT